MRPELAVEESSRGVREATPPARFSRYDFQSATCVRISARASFCSICPMSSAAGTLRIWPVRMRFMLLPMNADLFSR